LKSLPEIAEAFVLSTCNRTEVYLHTIDGNIDRTLLIRRILNVKKLPYNAEYRKAFYVLHNEDAVEHLFRVTTGIDSLVLGERQILGQVKGAVEAARARGMFLSTFNLLSHLAIKTGKKAQAETQISCGGSSMSWAAFTMVEKMLGTLEGKSVLVIGAGKMSELAMQQIHERGVKPIYVMNRTESNAQALTEKYGGIPVAFSEIKETLSVVDVGVCSVGAPHYILEKSTVEKIMQLRNNRPLILVDISMPRNIDPHVAEIPNVALSHIDDLKRVVDENMKKRQAAMIKVEQIVQAKVKEFYIKLKKSQNNTPGIFSNAS